MKEKENDGVRKKLEELQKVHPTSEIKFEKEYNMFIVKRSNSIKVEKNNDNNYAK